MTHYEVKATDTKKFTLTAADLEIGTLQYENWFSFKADIVLADGTTYQVVPKGFWGTTIELKKDDTVLLNFKMNWSGNIVIKMLDDEKNDFIFKPEGLLKSSFFLLDREERELIVIQPDFQWSKLNYNYTLSTGDEFGRLAYQEMLLLATVYCVNYYMALVTSTAVAASA